MKAICQAGKRKSPRWYSIHREISIYITWILLHTRITPNQVTCSIIVLGLIGAFLVSNTQFLPNIIGFVLLYLSFLLDKVDGEVARYYGTESIKGIYLDELAHLFIPAMLPLAVAFKVYVETDFGLVLVLGGISALTICLSRANKKIVYAIFAQKTMMNRTKLLQMNKVREISIKKGNKEQKIYWHTKVINFFTSLFTNFIIVLILFLLMYAMDYFSFLNLIFSLQYKLIFLIASSVFQLLLLTATIIKNYTHKIDERVNAIDKRISQIYKNLD